MVVESKATAEQDQGEVSDKKLRAAERKQQRAEKFAKYDDQLTKIRALGLKTTARHVRLLEKFNGNVDQVIATIASKKTAKLA